MAKRKPKRKHGGHGGAPVTPVSPEAILDEIEARAAEIETSDGAAAGPLWGAVHKLLIKAHADLSAAGRVIATRDVALLRDLLRTLRGEAPETPAEPEAPEPHAEIPAETLKKAMRAFRKRLKLTRLDHESKLGVGPMTGGRKADFDAIMAPQEFDRAVWEALADAGELKRLGKGFYMLGDA